MAPAHKLLLPWPTASGEKPVLEHVVQTLAAAHAWSAVRCVVGPEPPEIHAIAASQLGEPACVVNPHAARGKGTSLRAGLAALPEGLDGIVIALADMPLVPQALIQRIIARADAHTLIRCQQGSIAGPPVYFPAFAFPELRQISDTDGGRSVLQQCRNKLISLSVDDAAWLWDIDTPESYIQARQWIETH